MDRTKFIASLLSAVTAVAGMFGVIVAPEVLDGIEKVAVGVFAFLTIVTTFLPSIQAMWSKVDPNKEDA